jgi:hypothetical protein
MSNTPHIDKSLSQKVTPQPHEGTSLLERAREISGQLVAWRRDFHQHPELGFQ